MDSLKFRLHKEEGWDLNTPVAPWNYFDLICGTSTGGLIALMLGRLKMVFLYRTLILNSFARPSQSALKRILRFVEKSLNLLAFLVQVNSIIQYWREKSAR